jgi:hypothetical protein
MLEQNVSAPIKNILNVVALLFFLPFLLYATYQAMTLISRAAGTNANIVVDADAKNGNIDPSIMHAFAQGGEESKDMLKPIVQDIRTLKPKFIRIDHIYDAYDVVSRENGQLTFNFSKLDVYVNTIMSTGASPVFALSYMPPALSSDGTVIGLPNNWNEWSIVVQKTIEHYSGKNQKNLPGVQYEVWNEPDHAQFGGWKIGGTKNYITLYRYSQIGADRAINCNPFSLGGPSTTGLYKNWILGLIKENLRVDFFSWHTYTNNPLTFANDNRDLASWLKPFPEYLITPRLITEFGFNGAKDEKYGLSYASAFTASVFRQLTDAPVQYAFSFQLKDGPSDADGKGWGLITHESNGLKKKPRFFTYQFLDKMKGERLALSGEGSWVTALASKTDGTIRVLLINFDQSGYHSEDTPVVVTHLKPGEYTWGVQYLFTNFYKNGTCISSNTPTSNETVPAEGTWSKTICLSAQNSVIIELKQK